MSTNMDTGCPSLLMLLPDPPLRRNLLCLALTLGVATHLESGVETVAALTSVAGAIGRLREIVRSPGAIAVARGLPLDLDLRRVIDILETPHPGGESRPHDHH